MHSEVILVGAFRETIELCEDAELKIVGIFDANATGTFAGYPILGTDDDARTQATKWADIPLVISPDSPAIRTRLAAFYAEAGYKLRGIVSPQAAISRSAKIHPTAVIQAGANVSADAIIGEHAHLNVRCNVMHDCIVGPFATIAPNAVLLGRVTIAGRAYIGANATILPVLSIGDCATVGAGAVVTRNVEPGHVVVGCPARVLKTL